MPKRLTHEYVDQQFKVEGYQLLSKYKNSSTKLDFICPNEHKHSIAWNSFCSGARCAYCAGRVITQKQVEEAFKAEGYQLLSKYKNSTTKLDFICINGHKHSITWNSFNDGNRCRQCTRPDVTQKQVKKAFEAEGYQLLSEYKNSKTKLDFICLNGHKHAINWNNFYNGARCTHCVKPVVTQKQVKRAFEAEKYQILSDYKDCNTKIDFICANGHNHSILWNSFKKGIRCAYCSGVAVTPEQVKKSFEEEGYQLLSEYKGARGKLDFICPNGHKHSMDWACFNNGMRCTYCAGRVITQKQVEEAFKTEGYQLLSKYKNNKTKLDFICNNGHKHSMNWNCFSNGIRCADCFHGGFKPGLPGRLYYLRFDFPGMNPEKGDDARKKEQAILKKYQKFRILNIKLLRDKGDTELFDRDVLMLDSLQPIALAAPTPCPKYFPAHRLASA